MSQDTFPFAATEEAAGFEEAEGTSRKAVVLAGGVAAALVLGAGGWFLLGGSSDNTNAAAFVPSKTLRPAVTAQKKVATKPVKKLPAAYTVPLGRDPFKALYVVPAAAPAAAAGTTPTSTTGTAPTTTTTTTGTSVTPTGTAPTGTTRYTLKLVAISKPSPQVRFTTWSVAGTKKTVIPGQRFGKYGEVVVLAFGQSSSGAVDRAIIQVGDDSPMDVKIGESVSIL